MQVAAEQSATTVSVLDVPAPNTEPAADIMDVDMTTQSLSSLKRKAEEPISNEDSKKAKIGMRFCSCSNMLTDVVQSLSSL